MPRRVLRKFRGELRGGGGGLCGARGCEQDAIVKYCFRGATGGFVTLRENCAIIVDVGVMRSFLVGTCCLNRSTMKAIELEFGGADLTTVRGGVQLCRSFHYLLDSIRVMKQQTLVDKVTREASVLKFCSIFQLTVLLLSFSLLIVGVLQYAYNLRKLIIFEMSIIRIEPGR